MVALCATCFGPVESDGTLRCRAQDDGCPDGFTCRPDGFCGRMAGSAVDAAPNVDGPRSDGPRSDGGKLPACSNGIDDDCDGKIDMEDPGCSSPMDDDEHGTKKCDDGIDNDGDGYIDFKVPGCGPPGDPQCTKPDDDNET